jgi:hypothetical protein
MNNYYFKFGYSNELFEYYHKSISIGTEIELPIFFEKWTIEDRMSSPEYEKDRRNHTQINYFLNSPNEKSYYWIFQKGKIYVFRPIEPAKTNNNELYKDHPNYKNYKDTIPKTIKSRLVKIIRGADVPEIFSTINANQSYNRKTIELFRKEEKSISTYLINEEIGKMKISNKEKLNYLSPIQFETLIFLIFHHHNFFVTTFRGGTRKDIDLMVKSYDSDVDTFKMGNKYFLQIKKYDMLLSHPRLNMEGNDFLVHLGKTDIERNILGRDWIYNKISCSSKVDDWLNHSLEFFEIK